MNSSILTFEKYQDQVSVWAKPGGDIIKDATPGTAHLFHMGAAMLGEAVELEWAQLLGDTENIIEEVGDIFFYWTGLDWAENVSYRFQNYGSVSMKKMVETDEMMIEITSRNLDLISQIKFACAEVFDCTKKAFIYAQEPDFYRYSRFANLLRSYLLPELATNMNMELRDFYVQNFEKLSERMGTIYSNEAAQLRADKQ